MDSRIEIAVHPDDLLNDDVIEQKLKSKSGIKTLFYKLVRKSIDARGRKVLFRMLYEVSDSPILKDVDTSIGKFSNLSDQKPIYIIGAGPAGYFAALELIKLGVKPVVLERGKDVRDRRRDLRNIQQFGIVNPHSNYCFGEGGAGTYSDGKLYTRSHKRGKISDVLEILVEHGAPEDILTDAHPHIGSNKLPKIIANIRETICKNGGEVRFEHHLTDIIINEKHVEAIVVNDELRIACDKIILATGHSARDIFKLLDSKDVEMKAKAFALGVRIEHPQSYIDAMQYGMSPRHENLPAAPYSVSAQVKEVGVFSFCNCPGGLIVPAATAPGEIVVNGMSLSKRDSPFANSGFVTEIKIEDLEREGYKGVFAAQDFQKSVEQKLFEHGDGSQKAPAQLVPDFINGVLSKKLNDSSYIPGVYSAPLHDLLPKFVYQRLKEGLIEINKKMRGFTSSEAQIVGTESRTSSPITILRKPDTKEHVSVVGLYPCGEGAGFAGGILSAAMDGRNVARAVAQSVLS